MKNTRVIIATYNESGNLPTLLAKIFVLYPGIGVTVVDDNSPDGTGVVAEDLKGTYGSSLTVIHRPRKVGYGPACIHGIQETLKDSEVATIVTMDADLSHDPADIGRLIAASDRADFVLGSRFLDGSLTSGRSVFRNLISRLAAWYTGWMLGVKARDISTGFRCYHRKILAAMDFDHFFSQGYSFLTELSCRALRQGFRCVEIPITFHDRQHGTSKFKARMLLEALWIVARLR